MLLGTCTWIGKEKFAQRFINQYEKWFPLWKAILHTMLQQTRKLMILKVTSQKINLYRFCLIWHLFYIESRRKEEKKWLICKGLLNTLAKASNLMKPIFWRIFFLLHPGKLIFGKFFNQSLSKEKWLLCFHSSFLIVWITKKKTVLTQQMMLRCQKSQWRLTDCVWKYKLWFEF